MKKAFFLIGSAILISFGILFQSCEKNDSTTNKTSTNYTTAADYTALLAISDLGEVDEATEGSGTKSVSDTEFSPCFDVEVHFNDDGTFWPRSWTFTYNDPECLCPYGNQKEGKVHVTLTDYWKNEGSERTITFESFYINGNGLEGTRTILNTGWNDSGNLTFRRTYANGKYTKGDSLTMTWQSEREVEMVQGAATFWFIDDEYLVTGGGSGVNYDGASFTVTITDPLLYKRCSLFPVSGSLLIQTEGGTDITIDYGDGQCDNTAIMTKDGVATEVSLSNNV